MRAHTSSHPERTSRTSKQTLAEFRLSFKLSRGRIAPSFVVDEILANNNVRNLAENLLHTELTAAHEAGTTPKTATE